MKDSNVPDSAKYRYVPYAVRFLGGGSGIFIVLFAWILRLTQDAWIVYQFCDQSAALFSVRAQLMTIYQNKPRCDV